MRKRAKDGKKTPMTYSLAFRKSSKQKTMACDAYALLKRNAKSVLNLSKTKTIALRKKSFRRMLKI